MFENFLFQLFIAVWLPWISIYYTSFFDFCLNCIEYNTHESVWNLLKETFVCFKANSTKDPLFWRKPLPALGARWPSRKSIPSPGRKALVQGSNFVETPSCTLMAPDAFKNCRGCNVLQVPIQIVPLRAPKQRRYPVLSGKNCDVMPPDNP